MLVFIALENTAVDTPVAAAHSQDTGIDTTGIGVRAAMIL